MRSRLCCCDHTLTPDALVCMKRGKKNNKRTIEMLADLEKQQKNKNKAIHFSLSLTALPLCCQNRQRCTGCPLNALADTHSVCGATERRTLCLSSVVRPCGFFKPRQRTIKVRGEHTHLSSAAQRLKDQIDVSQQGFHIYIFKSGKK